MPNQKSPHGHWISGSECSGTSRETLSVSNPDDGTVLAGVTAGTADDVAKAVESAHEAFCQHRIVGPSMRESWLLQASQRLDDQRDEFVDLLIEETGSPISKARREVETAVLQLKAAAGLPRRIAGRTMPTDVTGRVSMSVRRPLGVIAGITPFNVPLIKGVKHSAFPLATGNSAVLLPAVDAPLTTLRLARLYSEAGVPAGMVNVVAGDGAQIGDDLTGHPAVKMVTFTGSTTTGRHVAERCGRLGKRFTLELGGKNPLVVLADAELPLAIQHAVPGAFLFQGQICMSSSRMIVEEPCYETFVNEFTMRAQSLGCGDLRDPQTMIGPIISEKQCSRIRRHLDDAIKLGAEVLTGNEWSGHRLKPTVLVNVPPDAVIRTEETFGPVVYIDRAKDQADALSQANDCSFGLSASVFTANLRAAVEFAEHLEAGMVHVNGGTIQEEAHVPFGGIRDSGFGREGTDAAIEQMTEWKWITIQP